MRKVHVQFNQLLMVIISHFAHMACSQQHRPITQKVNCCILKTKNARVFIAEFYACSAWSHYYFINVNNDSRPRPWPRTPVLF